MLCQLSYTRLKAFNDQLASRNILQPNLTEAIRRRLKNLLFFTRLLVERMPSEFRTILHQFQSFRSACFFADTVISQTGFGTFEPNILTSHRNTLTIKQKRVSAGKKQNEKGTNLKQF